LSRKRWAAFVFAQSLRTNGILSPGLEDKYPSKERNRLHSRASANSAPASSPIYPVTARISVGDTGGRRPRTVFFRMPHRTNAHGKFVSHALELNARLLCNHIILRE
jgi:hypothetical protein